MEKPTLEEIRRRIEKAKTANEPFDERQACCWQGYLAALLEWDLISPNDHKQLAELVPVEEPDPSMSIFLG